MEKVFREYEAILDRHHKTLPFWEVENDICLYALVSTYDSMILPLFLSGLREMRPSVTLMYKTLDDALDYCIKWLFEKNPIHIRTTKNIDIINRAGDYLSFGAQYADIADMHMMYGRGLVDIEIDEVHKKVKFCPIARDGKSEIDGYIENYDYQKSLITRNAKKNFKRYIKVMNAIEYVEHRCFEGRIIIDDVTTLLQEGVVDYFQSEIKPTVVGIDPNEELGGFKSEDYEKFWMYLKIWSHFAVFLYLSKAKKGIPQEECMPTQVMKYECFVCGMQKISGLPINIIAEIIKRLTYRQEKKSNILLQPFIAVDETILWSPVLVNKLRYKRNILKLMSRIPEYKHISDNIIGKRERPFLNQLGKYLSRKGKYQFKIKTRIKDDEQETDIDLLAYRTDSPNEVLIFESKTLLAVDETNEIADATAKLIDGQSQIETTVKVLRRMDIKQKEKLFKFVDWKKADSYYGIVITPESSPNTKYDETKIPCISFTTLLLRAKSRDLVRPSRLNNFCRDKRWLKIGKEESNLLYNDIKVGDITYSLPCFIYKNNKE